MQGCGIGFFEFWKKSIVARLYAAHVSTKAVVRILERYNIRATREQYACKTDRIIRYPWVLIYIIIQKK
ncbi:hypothetical protein APHDU1_1518 [Anaplasma phagocytophilum]|nr:hypothetical protein APHDU1_1518 [Anaplasma phagocytophilum]